MLNQVQQDFMTLRATVGGNFLVLFLLAEKVKACVFGCKN